MKRSKKREVDGMGDLKWRRGQRVSEVGWLESDKKNGQPTGTRGSDEQLELEAGLRTRRSLSLTAMAACSNIYKFLTPLSSQTDGLTSRRHCSSFHISRGGGGAQRGPAEGERANRGSDFCGVSQTIIIHPEGWRCSEENEMK